VAHKPTPAAELWLAVGTITGDQSRESAYTAATAQVALLEAVKDNALARSALGQLDRIEAVDSQVRAALPNDLAVLAGAEELPDGLPRSIVELHARLRPLRESADTGLAGA
jgi:hypothetical protein